MRQVLSWRFIAALAALLGLTFFVNAAFAGNPDLDELAGPVAPVERRPGLVGLMFEAQQEGFAIGPDGRSDGELTVILPPAQDGGEPRFIRIFAGTPGQVTCTALDEIGQCALLAEMLGDTVSWFALVPTEPSFRFELPAIVELDGGLAKLTNGWAVPYAPVIDRTPCETSQAESFGEFLRTVGQAHTSVFDLGTGRIIAVRC